MAKFRITNYGNTRKLPYKGECYEIIRQGSIETDDRDLAEALSSFQFVDMEEIKAVKEVPKVTKKEQPTPAEKPAEEKTVRKKKKKVATRKKSKKTKQGKNKGELK